MRQTQNRVQVIRAATAADGDRIATIYNYYITNTVVTFEETAISGEEMSRRIAEVQADDLPWLVAEDAGQIVGFAYASRWKSRVGYRFSVETTVYIAEGEGKRGIGSRLYTELFALLKKRGIHAAIGGIALPNDASIALHEKFGMNRVAVFNEVGKKFGKWVDVGYWELLLDTGSAE